MMGAHLDSWHAATGATDNAAGSAVVMEAMRILKALDMKMDRTVRVALWGGEEQGLLGSRGYVERLTDEERAGISAVLVEDGPVRIAGEFKLGKITVRDLSYLDTTYLSAAVSARKSLSDNVVVALSGTGERAQAKERAYSYRGGDLGASIDTFWPRSTMLIGARASLGTRRYAATDPFFGARRVEKKRRLDISVGNKRWRWRDRYLSVVASLERNHSSIAYYSYRKFNLSAVVE